jgi:hypothetical protein
MDDLNYLALKLSNEKASALIERDFDYLHETGALGVLSVHSQNYGEGGLMTALTPPYIERLKKHKQEVWSASGQEIENWWRSRERVYLKVSKHGSSPSMLQFSVQAPGNVKGLTFFVLHPSASKPLTSVVPEDPNSPRPIVQKIDSFRSAIAFSQNLPAGSYSYKIDF